MPSNEQEIASLREERSSAMFFGFTLRAAKAQARRDGLAQFLQRLDDMIAEADQMKENAEAALKEAVAARREPPPTPDVILLRAGAEW